MTSHDVIVIGGGISGLGLAHYCAQAGMRPIVIEQGARLGGAIHTERPADGFWLEMGAHTCYNTYGRLLDMAADCGLSERLTAREKLPWKMWNQGRTHSVASRLHWPELLCSLPRLAVRKRERESVAEYYSAVLGRRNFSEVALPMLNAVVSQDARDFPAGLIFKKRPRRKGVMRSFTLAGGLQTLPEAIAEADKFPIRTGSAAREAAITEQGWQVTTADGETHRAAALALAAPPGSAARLLQSAMPGLSVKLAGIRECGVASVGVVVRKRKINLPPLAGLVGRDTFFRSVVTRDVVQHPEFRGFVFHCKLSGTAQERLGLAKDMLGVRQRDLEYVAHRTHVLPSLGMVHAGTIAALERLIAGKRLALTGNYFSGLALEDCLARSAREAQRLATLL